MDTFVTMWRSVRPPVDAVNPAYAVAGRASVDVNFVTPPTLTEPPVVSPVPPAQGKGNGPSLE